MKKTSLSSFLIVVLISFIQLSCANVEETYTTFQGELIYSYLKKNPNYSEFVKLIDKAGYKGMLSAYGSYTCLAPTNKAIQRYYAGLGEAINSDKLRAGQVDTIVRNHIVPNKFLISDLTDGVIPSVNMTKRFIEIQFTTDDTNNKLKIMLNDSSEVISRDNEVYNGVVQGIDRLLEPSNVILPALISKNPEISIFNEALILTGLYDSLLLVKDYSYHPTHIYKDEFNTYNVVTPSERRYGYTALIESNSTLQQYGIFNLNDLIEKSKLFYPNSKGYESDYTNRKNSLNQFIAYHLIDKAIYLNKFFDVRNSIMNYTPDEFLETMLPNRIIRASLKEQRIQLNYGSDFTTKVQESGSSTTVNGVYHLLDKLLVYSEGVENMLLNLRIRFESVSLFPEFTNNQIRGSENFMTQNNASGDRFGLEPGYLKYLKASTDTRLLYLSGKNKQWASFQSDQFMGLGNFDITLRLLPVPPGTYELRMGYPAGPGRSIIQIYVDGKPIGIPLDLRIAANLPQIGWLIDSQTDDNGFENDKVMRNRGYMKGPNTIMSYATGSELNARDYPGSIRRIIGTFTFNDYQAHYIRFKSVLNDPTKQCLMDYFEFVPKAVFSPAGGDPETRD